MTTLEEVYSKAIREEQIIASARGRENQHDALGLVTCSTQQQDASSTTADVITISDTQSTARTDTILRIRDRSMLCSHCGRNGHEKRDCWQLVGYPDWWTERNKQSSRGRGTCRGGGCGGGRAANASAHATSANSSVFPDFTQDQWRVLSQLIHEKIQHQ